jgi:hypothetical protein
MQQPSPRLVKLSDFTQQGNTGTANAGPIASAIRFLVKLILVGRDVAQFARHPRRVLEIMIH